MICPSCGFLNQQQRVSCLKCGKTLKTPESATQGLLFNSRGTNSQKPSARPVLNDKAGTTTDEIVNKMRLDYSFSHGDPTQKVIDGLLALISESLKPRCDLGKLTVEAANLIQRHLGVREVAIGLRSVHDNLYRYKVMVGIRGEAERAMRRCVFREKDFEDSNTYKGASVSPHTKIYLAENMPFTEEERATYSRPILLDQPRKTWMESLEGDYLHIFIRGRDEDFIGWIELSGLRSGMLPDANTIRWVELIAHIIGVALASQGGKPHLPDVSLPGIDH